MSSKLETRLAKLEAALPSPPREHSLLDIIYVTLDANDGPEEIAAKDALAIAQREKELGRKIAPEELVNDGGVPMILRFKVVPNDPRTRGGCK